MGLIRKTCLGIFVAAALSSSLAFASDSQISQLTLKDSVPVKARDKKAERDLLIKLEKKAVSTVVEKIITNTNKQFLQVDYVDVRDQIMMEYRDFILDKEQLFKEYKKKKVRDYDLIFEYKFSVDEDEIRKRLVQDATMSVELKKYDAYVEMYWVAKKESLSPELIDITKENVKKVLIAQGFNIVDFSAIRDRILKLKNQDELTKNLDKQELSSFESNLEISQVSKYERGLAILAEYAQLLIGVTIRNIEVIDDLLNVDIATEAYFLKNGKRVEIAKVDKHGTAPYSGGSKQVLFVVAESVAQKAAKDLAVQLRDYLLSHEKEDKTVEESSVRTWKVVFPDRSAEEFYKLKRVLKKSDIWDYSSADTSAEIIELEYVGSQDDLADELYDFFMENGFKIAIPEFSAGGNKIVFNKSEG